MAYRRFNRSYSKPTTRAITVKFSGPCAACGATIKAGSIATFYPAGTLKHLSTGAIAHIGGLDGNSRQCAADLRAQLIADQNTNDYAGDGLDERYEDDCARACGL